MDVNATNSSVTNNYTNTTTNNTTNVTNNTNNITNVNNVTVVNKEEEPAATVEISHKKQPQVYDRAAVQKALSQMKDQNEAFIEMLQKLLNKQGKTFDISQMKSDVADFINGLNPDQETIDKAKEAVSEDGYYGVKQTSARILDFAKAIAGDDPAKIAEMRKAVEQGFGEAKKAWGKEMPEITGQTYDAVMKGFDEWETSAKAKASGVAAA